MATSTRGMDRCASFEVCHNMTGSVSDEVRLGTVVKDSGTRTRPAIVFMNDADHSARGHLGGVEGIRWQGVVEAP